MQLHGKLAGDRRGTGIGRALCREFARRGAAGIGRGRPRCELARATAAELSGLALQCDVAGRGEVEAMIRAAEAHYGRVDLLVSNAGFGADALDLDDALSAPDARWQRMWDVHVMAHARACRAVLPGMLARGTGCVVNVASAAGLLSQSVTRRTASPSTPRSASPSRSPSPMGTVGSRSRWRARSTSLPRSPASMRPRLPDRCLAC